MLSLGMCQGSVAVSLCRGEGESVGPPPVERARSPKQAGQQSYLWVFGQIGVLVVCLSAEAEHHHKLYIARAETTNWGVYLSHLSYGCFIIASVLFDC